MTRVHHRRKQQYALAGFVGIVVAGVTLFFLFFYLPARVEYAGLERTILELRAGVVERTQTLKRLEDAERRLANAREGRDLFLSSSLVSRERGFAALLPDLSAMASRAGIERPGAAYQISDTPMYGVYPVEIIEPIRGDYASVRQYIEELETSERFFILDSLSMGRSGEGNGADLDVQLMMSTFFAESHE